MIGVDVVAVVVAHGSLHGEPVHGLGSRAQRLTREGWQHMRVLISVDMEGVAGVVDPDDISPGQPEYERNRRLMTAEANAAVRGVLQFDRAAEVLVSDAHARYRNILPELLDRRCELLRGTPKPFGMLAGIDTGVDAVLFVGYHGKAGTPDSVLAHSVSGGVIGDIRCNGRSLGEIGLNVALAAHFGAVPVLVTGDGSVAREAGEVAPGIHAVTVKRALGARAASSLHPEEACDRIESTAVLALASRDEVSALRFDGPVELEVRVHRTRMAEQALLVPGMRFKDAADGCTLAYSAPDFPTAYNVIELIILLGML
ncbi:M55 family metallopeptidase [Actinospica robiniae]|uniref:M55 family metallopeptidase n=1 Tax=Actinospica robiniae TaxID=304901 RepID=UPI0009FEFA1D|nr:M55 family metallopeptidase [Actinospica robiniae]